MVSSGTKFHLIGTALWLCLCLPGLLHAQEDRTISYGAQQVVKTVVGETGNTYLGQGSWVNEGKKFGATSDVDLEAVIDIPKPKDPAKLAQWEKQMMDKWKQSQRDLIAKIKSQYPPDKAREMLSRMNVYPPSQVMDDAADGAQALSKFKQHNSVPNLAALDDIDNGVIASVSDIDRNTLKNATEGVYGPDARRWIQNDRMKPGNGQVFYKDPKTGSAMVSRFTDLEHLAQGGGTYTVKGSANLSSQLIDKVMDDIHMGDARKAAKNLERLKAELKILKNKSGVHVDLSELDDMINSGNLGKAKDLLAGAKLRCELLKQGGGKLSLIEKMLEKGGKASAKLLSALEKLPLDKIGMAVNGLFITFQAVQMGVDISKGNYADALVNLGLALSPAAIAILGTITKEMLDAAKELGFNLVAGRQECYDMLGGIYPDNPDVHSVQGGADVSLVTLLLKYSASEEQDLVELIKKHAALSSNKEGVSALNEAKCLNTIVPSWKEARILNGQQFKDLVQSMEITLAAKVLKEEKIDEGLNDIQIFENLRDEFMRHSGDADRYADEVYRYVSAFQNSIGSKDASPCKNPAVAYFWRMAKSSFDSYSRAVSDMADREYRLQLRAAALRKSAGAATAPGDPPKPGSTVRASLGFIGSSFASLKPQLDGYARLVCGEGGYAYIMADWYLDGTLVAGATGVQTRDIEDVPPGEHLIECKFELMPYGPKDKTLAGFSYAAQLFAGAQITIPEPESVDPEAKAAADKAAIDILLNIELPQIEGILTDKINRTASLGEQVMACTEQLRASGCDLDEVDKLGNDIAQNGLDPDAVNNGLREICGDGIDNNGNGLIDEDCTGGGTVIITVWDSGSLADDSFTLTVTGYGNLGSTPAGGQRMYMINLPPGTYTATLTCILAPDDVGTYSISFSGSASGSGGDGSISNGASAKFEFPVQQSIMASREKHVVRARRVVPVQQFRDFVVKSCGMTHCHRSLDYFSLTAAQHSIFASPEHFSFSVFIPHILNTMDSNPKGPDASR